MKPYFSMSVLALALVGCASANRNEAPGPAAQATGLNPQLSRITDSRIKADRQALEALQTRLQKLSEAGVAQNNYSLAKAQCWLDTAKTQYHENDRTGYVEESMAESAHIIGGLEKDKNARVGLNTALVARSTKLREDLWAQLAAHKNSPTALACNARTVACGEVRLVRAGHADEQTGWRAAVPHVQMAEDAVRRAAQEAAACPVVPTLPGAAAAAAALATPPPAPGAPGAVAAPGATAPVITRESFVLLGDALFKFDKFGRDEMLPGGKERLAAVAARLKAYQSIRSMVIVGHTDRLGGQAYNDALSASRAATVRSYLESLGVRASGVSASGVGERAPVTTSCSDRLPRAKLIECLQPDRRVTIEVTGIAR